ncbi:MAG: hypothetical protein HY680_01055 [Chloroflexi bacterium]|nr:hypothetical protein [Chloroflexota bacterium]
MIEQDEMLHKASPLAGNRMYNDRICLMVVDRQANVFGVNQIQASTNRGFARFRAAYSVGGTKLSYANRTAIAGEPAFEKLSDGHMTYQVVEPLKEVRVSLDGPEFCFDLAYKGRFEAFDYANSLEGNPLGGPQHTGGHYEQSATCKGEFEVKSGPKKGRHAIDCLAVRSHTWDVRFSDKAVWDLAPGEYNWMLISLPERQLSLYVATGEAAQQGRLHEGGYNATPRGRRIWRRTRVNVDFAAGPQVSGFDATLTQINRDVFRVRSKRRHDQVHLPMYGESDQEAFLNCYYDFFDAELEDTGEQGCGVFEHAYFP